MKTIAIDPWHEKRGRLSTIILVLLVVSFVFAMYDGATFYARFQQFCIDHPNSTECRNFTRPANVPTRPKLDIVLDYGNGKYAIQIGAYKNEVQAKAAVTQLQPYEVQSRIIKVKDSKHKILYKVQIGRFSDQKLASQAAQQLKARGFIQNFIVTSYVTDRWDVH